MTDDSATERRNLVDKTHPGFTIRCDKCASKDVIVDSSVGFSETSGGWGSVDLKCLECGATTAIWDTL